MCVDMHKFLLRMCGVSGALVSSFVLVLFAGCCGEDTLTLSSLYRDESVQDSLILMLCMCPIVDCTI